MRTTFRLQSRPILFRKGDRDEEGNIEKWFGTCTDITDRKQAEALDELGNREGEVRTPKPCSGIVTAVETAAHKTECPYRQTADAILRAPGSDFDILLTPKVYVRR